MYPLKCCWQVEHSSVLWYVCFYQGIFQLFQGNIQRVTISDPWKWSECLLGLSFLDSSCYFIFPHLLLLLFLLFQEHLYAWVTPVLCIWNLISTHLFSLVFRHLLCALSHIFSLIFTFSLSSFLLLFQIISLFFSFSLLSLVGLSAFSLLLNSCYFCHCLIHSSSFCFLYIFFFLFLHQLVIKFQFWFWLWLIQKSDDARYRELSSPPGFALLPRSPTLAKLLNNHLSD